MARITASARLMQAGWHLGHFFTTDTQSQHEHSVRTYRNVMSQNGTADLRSGWLSCFTVGQLR
jgi:hypothetical protein